MSSDELQKQIKELRHLHKLRDYDDDGVPCIMNKSGRDLFERTKAENRKLKEEVSQEKKEKLDAYARVKKFACPQCLVLNIGRHGYNHGGWCESCDTRFAMNPDEFQYAEKRLEEFEKLQKDYKELYELKEKYRLSAFGLASDARALAAII